MNKYARAKQVVCPDCEAGIGKPCKDLRGSLFGDELMMWGRRIKRPHKQRVVKAEGGG
jgi:hypothetical protein